MSRLATGPCEFCPYRKDVPSGVWSAEEYAKLRSYDAETPYQPLALFMCHAIPTNLCYGWAVCHQSRGRERELLALRIVRVDVPETPSVPLFASGKAAATHGMKALKKPLRAARKAIAKLTRKYRRLQSK